MKPQTIGIICLIVITATIGRAIYVEHQKKPVDAYRLMSEPKVEKEVYHLGDEISWAVVICKLHNDEFSSARTLRNVSNGKEYLIPENLTQATLQKGECATVNPKTRIPSDNPLILPDRYVICPEIVVVNPKKAIKPFKYCTNEFRIE